MMEEKRKGIAFVLLYKLQHPVCAVITKFIVTALLTIMKRAATFCVLVTLFFRIGDAEDNAEDAVAKLKTTTKMITSELELYGNTLVSDLHKKLDDQKKHAFAALNSITNPVLRSVRTAIDGAQGNAKHAENCYELARLELKQTSYIDANIEMDQCANDALATMNPIKRTIDETVLIGNRLMSQLDHMNINCLVFLHLNYRTCINEQMPKLSYSVTSLEKTIEQLKRNGDSVSSSALSSASSCNQASIDKVHQDAEDVRVSSTNCIFNAYIESPPVN